MRDDHRALGRAVAEREDGRLAGHGALEGQVAELLGHGELLTRHVAPGAVLLVAGDEAGPAELSAPGLGGLQRAHLGHRERQLRGPGGPLGRDGGLELGLGDVGPRGRRGRVPVGVQGAPGLDEALAGRGSRGGDPEVAEASLRLQEHLDAVLGPGAGLGGGRAARKAVGQRLVTGEGYVQRSVVASQQRAGGRIGRRSLAAQGVAQSRLRGPAPALVVELAVQLRCPLEGRDEQAGQRGHQLERGIVEPG